MARQKPQAHTEAINEDVKDSKIPDNSSPSPFQEAVAAVTPTEHSEPVPVPETRLPLLKVVTTLLRSPRAMVTILITLIQGYAPHLLRSAYDMPALIRASD